ncbi:MAG: TonB-dependent receptor [Flavitalea sp.]
MFFKTTGSQANWTMANLMPRMNPLFIKTMRLTVLLLTVTCLTVSAKSIAQKITYSGRNVSLEKLFKAVKNQTGYVVFFKHSLIDNAKPVTIDASNVPLQDFMNLILKDQLFDYKIESKTIVISPKTVVAPAFVVSEKNDPVIYEPVPPITVHGRILNEKGEPLEGVTVMVKGNSKATITNTNGEYTIVVPNKSSLLVFSFVGYASIERAVNNNTSIDLTLAVENKIYEEVVVVGYGTQRKKDLTGAVSSVKTSDLVLSQGPDIGDMLKGKAAGLMIRQNSAQPGGGLDIMIRGAGSINASNDPLIVVDGFPISDLQQPESGGRYVAGTQSVLNSFNPNDIESIEVLKDASATAIYGSRAANGVILITTKRGSGTDGAATIQYSGNYSLQKYKNPFDVLPLNEWMQVRNEAAWEQWNFSNNVIPYGTRTLEEAKAAPVAGDFHNLYTQNAINNVGRGTDWFGLVTRDGATQQHNITISGGNQNTKYLISGNYYNQDGIIKNAGFQRASFRANIDQKLNKYVKLGINLTSSRINNTNSSLGKDQYENSGILRAAIQQGPHIKPIDEDGNYPLNPQLALQPNPYSLLTITDKGRIERTLVNSFLDITPINGLLIKVKAGLDRGITDRWSYLPTTTLHGASEHGRAAIGNSNVNDYLLEATANYTKSFATVHNFNVLVGVSEQKTKTDQSNQSNTGFITDAFLWNNLNAGSGTKVVGTSRQENMIASYFGRLNYNYKERYLLTATVRTDGASVFARNNKWGTFPSVAFGWNIADEPFFSRFNYAVPQLKLRVSYGQTGNASIGSNAFAAYNAYPAWLSGNNGIDIGVSLGRLENPDLKWETTTETNIGLDYSILKGRISGSLELYKKIISDLLAFKPLNSYNELNQVMANIGETQSKGFELTINTLNVSQKDFQWRTIFTFSKFQDTWRKRADDWKPAVYESANDPIRAEYSRVSDGILQIGDKVESQPELKPGMIKIKDINGYVRDGSGNPVVDENGRFLRTGAPDGIIDDADTKLIGTTDPKLIAGFSNIVTYKNFSLNVDFNGLFGRKMEDPNYTTYGVSAEPIYTYGYNAFRTVKDRWTPEKPSTTHPSSYYGWSPYGSGNFFLQEASFFRLQNVSLGYNLPKRWIQKVFTNVQVHVDAHNLFVITPYTGIDPETDSYTAAYPNIKTFTAGLSLTFK